MKQAHPKECSPLPWSQDKRWPRNVRDANDVRLFYSIVKVNAAHIVKVVNLWPDLVALVVEAAEHNYDRQDASRIKAKAQELLTKINA